MGIEILELNLHTKVLPKQKKYFRSKNFTRRIIECKSCNHLYSVHKINLNNFYKNNTYLKKHYGDMSKLYETFQKIRKLDLKNLIILIELKE